MERFAPRTGEHPDIVGIPQVVRIVIVRVEPEIIVITVEIEQSEIAIRIGLLRKVPSMPPPFEYSLGCILFGI